jgi:prepilin-type N-terminal cleavage/methylation domain-containing protein
MISLKNKQSGFTIVELLIVIVVIGILAALVITTFNGIQQKGRDTERQTDIKAIHGQLEAYYAQNGNYPTLAEIDTPTEATTLFKGLDKEALSDPQANPKTYVLVSAPAAKAYSYQVYESDGTTNCTVAANCAKYILTTTTEGLLTGGTANAGVNTYVKVSLN